MTINNLVETVKDKAMPQYLNMDCKVGSFEDYMVEKYHSILPKNKTAKKIVNAAVLVVPGSFVILGTYFLASGVYGAITKIIKK